MDLAKISDAIAKCVIAVEAPNHATSGVEVDCEIACEDLSLSGARVTITLRAHGSVFYSRVRNLPTRDPVAARLEVLKEWQDRAREVLSPHIHRAYLLSVAINKACDALGER